MWKYSGTPASKSKAHAQLLKGSLYNNFIFGNSLTDFALERKKECFPITEGGQIAGCMTFGWRISRGNSGIGQEIIASNSVFKAMISLKHRAVIMEDRYTEPYIIAIQTEGIIC